MEIITHGGKTIIPDDFLFQRFAPPPPPKKKNRPLDPSVKTIVNFEKLLPFLKTGRKTVGNVKINNIFSKVNYCALEGGLRITPSGGGGAFNAPPSISAPMRANATNFGGYLGLY